MTSFDESDGMLLPFTLCAGVGRAVVNEVAVLWAALRSVVLGEKFAGLCGV